MTGPSLPHPLTRMVPTSYLRLAKRAAFFLAQAVLNLPVLIS